MKKAEIISSAFSLIELVISLVIIGLMAAIAVPRVSSAGRDVRVTALSATLSSMRTAIDLYTTEHDGRTPDQNQVGNTDSSGPNFVKRLAERTDGDGGIDAAGAYGPYIRKFPVNPFNELDSVRIGGSAPGSDTHGWHYDPTSLKFSADDSPEHASY